MGKIIIIAIIAAVGIGVVLWFGIGGGFGGGAGDGEGDGNTKIITNTESSSDVENDTVVIEEKEEEKEETEGQNNGATDTFEGAIVNVSVVNNDYFYDNERISLDDFLIILHGIESDLVVQVRDDNASLRAYDELINKLQEEKIRYVEE